MNEEKVSTQIAEVDRKEELMRSLMVVHLGISAVLRELKIGVKGGISEREPEKKRHHPSSQ